MVGVDKDRMKFVILELEEDGADHPGAEIDGHLERVFAVAAREMSTVHQNNRSVFANQVDWAKAALTEQLLHQIVGAADGQNVYRITARGREEIAQERRRRELVGRAYGRGKKPNE